MSDAKTEYRTHVWSQKKNSFFDLETAKKISKGMERASRFKNKWQSVNINEFVQKFTPDPIISVDKGKLTFMNKDGKMAIIADLGGTYCRLADMTGSKPFYLDINGKDPRNYTDAKGKQHGRKKEERQEITHFRIQKWHEMTKYLPVVIKEEQNGK